MFLPSLSLAGPKIHFLRPIFPPIWLILFAHKGPFPDSQIQRSCLCFKIAPKGQHQHEDGLRSLSRHSHLSPNCQAQLSHSCHHSKTFERGWGQFAYGSHHRAMFGWKNRGHMMAVLETKKPKSKLSQSESDRLPQARLDPGRQHMR